MTADGTILEVNDAFVRILGHIPEGLPYPPPFPWWPDPDNPVAARAATHSLTLGLSQDRGGVAVALAAATVTRCGWR